MESSVTLGHYLPKSGYLVNIVEIKTFDSKWKASNRFLITEVQIKSKKSVDIENDKTSPPI